MDDEKNVKLRIGGKTDFVEATAPVPADDKWHEVHAVVRVRKTADGKTLYAGERYGHVVTWYLDGEQV